jgi:transmembrane sensor
VSVDLPSPQALEAQGPTRAAALWLERLQRDDAGADDAAFRRWLQASEANRRAWDRALDLWDALEEPDDEGVLEGLRREALTLRSRRPVPAPLWYAAAASIALVVAAGILVANLRPVGGHRPPPAQVASGAQPDLGSFGRPDYQTKVGERSTVQLADGTRVELDTDSAIDVAYARGLRLVRLVRGQAFFVVAHDAAHPFRVAADGRVVSDLGTRFDIRLQGAETRVALVEGSVGVTRGDDPAVTPSGDAEMLKPGQELIARPGRADEIVQADVQRASDWRRGVVQFDNTSLSDAVAELNRYTTNTMIIRDPKIAALRVSGAFHTGDTAHFGQTLEALYPVRVTPLADGRLEIASRP